MHKSFLFQEKVVDEKGNSVSYTNVVIHNKLDDTFVSGTSTDDNGVFVLNGIQAGSYTLKN